MKIFALRHVRVILFFLFFSLSGLIFWGAGFLYFVDEIYGPSLILPFEASKENLPLCKPSTYDVGELILKNDSDRGYFQRSLSEHGMAIIPSILTKQTTERFRKFVLKANSVLPHMFVMEKENRHHICPSSSEPTVHAILREVAEHPVLRPLMEESLGRGFSLTGFSVITNYFGSSDQQWHPDVFPSINTHPEYFVPEFTLAIALQDTTRDMGATGICPGLHGCGWADYDVVAHEKLFNSLDENIRQKYNDDYETFQYYDIPGCNLTAELKEGDGLFYSTDALHQGRAHTNPKAPPRSVVFLIFSGAPREGRNLPMGQVHALDFSMWGITINEFSTIETKTWKWYHSFGINVEGKRWTLFDEALYIFSGSNTAFVYNNLLPYGFNREAFSVYTRKALEAAAMMGTLCWFLLMWMTKSFVFQRKWLNLHKEIAKVKTS